MAAAGFVVSGPHRSAWASDKMDPAAMMFPFADPADPVGYDHFAYYDNDLPSLEELSMRAGLEGRYRCNDAPLPPEIDWPQPDAPRAEGGTHASSSFPQRPFAFSGGSNTATPAPGRLSVPSQGGRVWERGNESNVWGGQISHQRGHGVETVDGNSESPVDVFTPNSSHKDYTSVNGSSYEEVEDEDDSSAISAISPTSGSVARGHHGRTSRLYSGLSTRDAPAAAVRLNNLSPHPLPGSGASRVSSTAPLASSTPRSLTGSQWGSVTPTVTWMDGHEGHGPPDQFNNFSAAYPTTAGHEYATPAEFNDYLYSDAGSFGTIAATNIDAPLAFRGFEYNAFEDPYGVDTSERFAHLQYRQYAQQQIPIGTQHQQSSAWPWIPEQHAHEPDRAATVHNQPSWPGPSLQEQRPETLGPQTTEAAHPEKITTSRQQTPRKARQSVPGDGASRRAPLTQRLRTTPAQRVKKDRNQNDSPQQSHSSNCTGTSNRNYQPLLKAGIIVGSGDASQQATSKARRGGRQKNSHLPEPTKQKISNMRQMRACWGCKMQRDECDAGSPCGRCLARSQKGQTYFFECNRSKLQDFVTDFLPPSMTIVHQKQSIMNTVHAEVFDWNRDNSIHVYLTSGYGPALGWKLYEFKPRTHELLGQLQYFRNPETGISEARYKYSPPFGLLLLDESDEAHVNTYLDQLMTEQYLWELGWTCFEEEARLDESAFQPNLLHFMCNLYLETEDGKLKTLLHNVIRMMIITYIMAHTLTIVEDTLPDVLSHVKLTEPPAQVTRHTSPRLANRQLKFFFAYFRMAVYNEILKNQHNTFQTGGKKESSWLTSFCAMLGFAMVLEEVQSTLHIQADAKVFKNEMTQELANAEANEACKVIDDRYRLLIGLFQCKYRDKTWGADGSFGPDTPRLVGHAENQFLSQLRELVHEKHDYLLSRQDVEIARENHNRYTSRLVARFLLPFLGLPG